VKRGLRVVFYFAAVLLWLLVGFIALEALARSGALEDLDADLAAVHASRHEAEPLNEAVREVYATREPRAEGDFERRERVFETDRTEWPEIVHEDEAVVLFGPDETAVETYFPPRTGNNAGTVSMAALYARRFSPGTTPSVMTSEPAREDFRRALDQVRSGAAQQVRDYPLYIQGAEDVLQFAFVAAPEHSDYGAAVFIRPSMWEKLWVDFRPNVYQHDSYEFETNALGWRDDAVAVPKPQGLYRIVCIGGSTTAEGPTNELTYPNILEKKLQARYGEDRVEVVNAGVFASTSYTEAARLEGYLELEPDLVMHCNFVNDVTNFLPAWMEEERSEKPWKAWLARSHFVYNHFNEWLLPSEEILREGIATHTLGPLSGLADGLAAAGVDMAFASFPAPDYDALTEAEQTFFDHEITSMIWGRTISMSSYCKVVDLYNAMLKERCAERGWTYLEVADSMGGGVEVYTDICHMTLFGMERKAQAFLDALQPMLDQRLGVADGDG